MGQYYLLVNHERKQYLSPCFGFKALETYTNDAEFYGQCFILLYQDLSCRELGGGDIPYSKILTKKEQSLIGSWNKTAFTFMGDYSTDSPLSQEEIEKEYHCLNPEMEKIITKILKRCY
jgi:hypothetical protein